MDRLVLPSDINPEHLAHYRAGMERQFARLDQLMIDKLEAMVTAPGYRPPTKWMQDAQRPWDAPLRIEYLK